MFGPFWKQIIIMKDIDVKFNTIIMKDIDVKVFLLKNVQNARSLGLNNSIGQTIRHRLVLCTNRLSPFCSILHDNTFYVIPAGSFP